MKTSLATLAVLLLSVPLAGAGRDEPITPIPAAVVTNPALVELGKKLYFDPRLSKSGFISCNSCHNLSMGGSDNLPTSIGHAWHQGPINAPTVLNSSLSVAQFWDGRAKTLQEQAGGPIANPGEMALTHDLAVGVIASIPGYVDEFQGVFGAPGVDIDSVTLAIAAFEETLVTPNSRFDRWLMRRPSTSRNTPGISCSRRAAAHPATTAQRREAGRSARWASSRPIAPRTPPKGAWR